MMNSGAVNRSMGLTQRSVSTLKPMRTIQLTPPQKLKVHTKAAASAARSFQRTDSYQERIRPVKAQTVFDHPNWSDHRSLIRYIKHILLAYRSTLYRSIMLPILVATGFAALICGYNSAVANGLIEKTLGKALPALNVPQAFMTLPSFAISLLLVFRTNSSYGRWDEARKMWGLLLNRNRDLARQAVTYFPPHAIAAKRMLARWMVCMQKALLVHFRPGGTEQRFREVMGDTLPPEELEMVAKAGHRPVYAMHMVSEVITAVHVHPQYTIDMMSNLTTFHDILGGCERILRTPIPLSYTRHTARCLVVWLGLLPMALWASIGWASVPVVAFMATLLLGIEEIGVSIEEPFGVLALEVIQKRAETDVWSQVEATQETYEYVQDTLIREGALVEQAPAPVYAMERNGGSNGAAMYINGNGKELVENGKRYKLEDDQ